MPNLIPQISATDPSNPQELTDIVGGYAKSDGNGVRHICTPQREAVRRSILLVVVLIFQGVVVANENKFDSGHAIMPVASVGGFSSRPSQNDIEVAKQTKKTVYVVWCSGLFAVDPSGNVTNTYSDLNWMKK